MTAGRGSHDANPIRIQAPFLRIGADVSDGSLNVVHHGRVPVAAASEAVLEHERRDALLVQPERIVDTLMRGQGAVAAARTDDERCPVAFPGGATEGVSVGMSFASLPRAPGAPSAQSGNSLRGI